MQTAYIQDTICVGISIDIKMVFVKLLEPFERLFLTSVASFNGP